MAEFGVHERHVGVRRLFNQAAVAALLELVVDAVRRLGLAIALRALVKIASFEFVRNAHDRQGPAQLVW